MDPLSDVLRVLQLSGALLFRAEVSAPWCFAVPDAKELLPAIRPHGGRLVQFHVIVSGRCVAEVAGDPLSLATGDVIVLPRGNAHLMCSGPGVEPVSVKSVLPTPLFAGDTLPGLSHAGGGASTTILCGFLAGDEPIFDPLLSALPSVIVDRTRSSASRSWFDAMLTYVLHPEEPRPGWRGMQTRLVELMFVEVLLRHVASLPDGQSGWLGALRDPDVSRAIGALHADPSRAWTVALLAKRVGLSRSILAERFRAATGMPPMQYLASWRLQVAASLMRELSIAETAARVGYSSEAAFNRAFKRVVGQPPAAWLHARAATDERSREPAPRSYP